MTKKENLKAIDLANKHQTIINTQQQTATKLANERKELEDQLKEKQDEIATTIWEGLIDVEGLGRQTKVSMSILLKRPIVEIENWNFFARYTKGEMDIYTTEGKMSKVSLSTLVELQKVIVNVLNAEGLI